jgi:hypothetical protein
MSWRTNKLVLVARNVGRALGVNKIVAKHLSAPSLRSIGIEVHFGILKDRGMSGVPKLIEELLQRNGFVVHWPDSSHILAKRPNQ